MRLFIAFLMILPASNGAVVLDRMAIVVGKRVVKASDIDRDVRLTQFLNREPVRVDSKAKHESAERLVDQEIIRAEISTGNYKRPPETDAAALEKQLVRDRFGGSQARLRQTLAEYGLTESQLRAHLLWQLTVLRFIDERFRASVLLTDEEIRKYYDEHLAELRRQNPRESSFEALEPKIRSQLQGERINENFNQWMEQARKRYQIEYKQEALG